MERAFGIYVVFGVYTPKRFGIYIIHPGHMYAIYPAFLCGFFFFHVGGGGSAECVVILYR